MWREQYRAWLPARAACLRLDVRQTVMGRGSQGEEEAGNDKRSTCATKINKRPSLTVVQALRQGAHQYLDDVEYSYQRMHLHLRGGLSVNVDSSDPGADAVGVETMGRGREEVVVIRRLDGVLSRTPPPELVVRTGMVGAGYLAGEAP